jgi:hypothetical protein
MKKRDASHEKRNVNNKIGKMHRAITYVKFFDLKITSLGFNLQENNRVLSFLK